MRKLVISSSTKIVYFVREDPTRKLAHDCLQDPIRVCDDGFASLFRGSPRAGGARGVSASCGALAAALSMLWLTNLNGLPRPRCRALHPVCSSITAAAASCSSRPTTALVLHYIPEAARPCCGSRGTCQMSRTTISYVIATEGNEPKGGRWQSLLATMARCK